MRVFCQRGSIPLLSAVLGSLLVLATASCDRSRERVVVIGVDGGTLDLVLPWIEQGKLPAFARLLAEGAHGSLLSPVPPSSAPAWTSATTGVNPGKHGIFGFIKASQEVEGGRRATTFYTSRDRRAEPVWSVLGRAGRKVGLMNIPLTSPPDSVNGFMISGFPHPSEGNFVWPPELGREILSYRIDVYGREAEPGREEEFLNDMFETTDRREETALRLMEEKDWDLFWVVFTVTDRVQHYFWRYMDPSHPLYEENAPEPYRDAVLHAYQRVDAAIGHILDRADERTTVIVLSDHGFGPTYHQVMGETFLSGVDLGPDVEAFATDNFGAKFGVRLADGSGAADTTALEKGRAALLERLRTLTDQVTGERIVDRVWQRDELYHGPYLDRAADVIGLEREGYLFLNWVHGETQDLVLAPNERFLSAFHRVDGLLFMRGPGVKAGLTLRGARLIDLTPTVLALLAVPIPDNTDGVVLKNAFRDGWSSAHDVGTQPGIRIGEGEDAWEDTTQAELERQLRSIGYVR